MIVDYDRRPTATIDQKIQTLIDSIMLALNEKEDRSTRKGSSGGMMKSDVLDVFYPVGSYYETSDTSFDPNASWGGTWSLETAGQVHVSAGTGYTAGDTGGSSSSSYTPAGTVGDTTLTAAQSGMPAHSHGPYSSNYGFVMARNSISGGDMGVMSGSGRHYAYQEDSSNGYWARPTSTGTAAATDATSAHNHSFTGTAASINVMQPYVVVNRWHRTA